MNRWPTIRRLLANPSTAPHRRGGAWQRPRRLLEQQVHGDVLDFCAWAATQGLNRQEAAAPLELAARTVRGWAAQAAAPGEARLRGRPLVRSPREQRQQVLALLDSVGPGLGLPSLQGQFAELPRAELRDLLHRYRRVWVQRHHQALHVLHWQQPGSVWAIDFAEPAMPLEEGFTDLLAVRDLASGQQLLWLPVAAATAQETIDALLLFTMYGAPLVLKMDNGSPFVAAATQALLALWEVVPLFSPPGLPAYNGSIEAGIGSLKARTHAQAARQGHPELWTCADLEAARQAANTLARPQGAHGPTPEQAWTQRRPVTAAERTAFRATVVQLAEEGQQAAAVPPPEASPSSGPGAAPAPPTAAAPSDRQAPPGAATPAGVGSPAQERPADLAPVAAACPPKEPPSAGCRPARDSAASPREAIRRALVAHGYLRFRRRRIHLPIKRKKAAKIM